MQINKQFFIILIKYDLDNQIKDMHQSQSDYEDIYSKYNDTTREIKKILNEVKKCFTIIKP